MQAIVFEQAGEPAEVLRLREIPPPEITDQQVLVAVKARPFNPSDEYFIKGVYRKKPVLPQIAGLEASGIIIQTGAGVTRFKTGDHVAFRAMNTWAEYCAVDETALIAVDGNIPFDISAQIPLNFLTAKGLLDEVNIQAGDYLLLDASSSALARMVIQMAFASGIHVIALVRNIANSAELMELGARAVIGQDDVQMEEKILAAAAGAGIAGFLDAVGGRIVTKVIPLMKQYGTIVIYGRYSNEEASFGNGAIVYKNLTLKGFGIDRWTSLQTPERVRSVYESIVEQIKSNKLSTKIGRKLTLGEFVQEYKSLAETSNGKVILV
jgi:NADPH:quinone reductase-like Zn-dependent oxidoreductase